MVRPVRIEAADAMRLVGLNRTYSRESRSDIPAQWGAWEFHKVTGIVGELVYGVSHGFAPPDRFDYACALRVSEDAPVPQGQTEIRIPAGDYAVFQHDGHVSGIAGVFDAVLCGRAELDGWRVVPGPQLEVYCEDFNPQTACGRVELWFPVERA